MNKNIPSASLIALAVTIAVSGLSGCATVTKGSSQTVTVNTDPAGAKCILQREGQTIGIVNPTPGSVLIDKDKDVVSVTCEKEGYQETASVLASQFQAMTLGNILIGGIIGVAIDAGTGAMNEYPPMVSVALSPNKFNSLAERDSFFDNRRNALLSQYDELAKNIEKNCANESCEQQLKAVEEEKNLLLVKIEKQRTAAAVTSASM